MRTVSYRIGDLDRVTIHIGRVAENEYTQIRIDAGEIYAEYPHAAAALTVQPPMGEAYPAVVTREGDTVVWDVPDSALAQEGDGEIQLTFEFDSVVVKSAIAGIRVCRSLIGEGEAPDPLEDFLAEAGAALTAIPETIDAALEEAKESGEFDGPPGPQGQEGPQGNPGPAGNDGKDGTDGRDGADGYSPTASVSKSGKTATITITDKNGTTTAQISDGEDGQGADLIDDTTTTATDKAWSAKKTNDTASDLLSAVNGKISEPASEGTSGQVLTTDGNGGRSWTTSGLSSLAVNYLIYILRHATYTVAGMEEYITALQNELSGGSETYLIVNTLTHVTNSNDQAIVNDGDPYTATLSADAGYSISTVSIVMGSTDITATAYNSETGAISIASVTGQIEITAAAEKSMTYHWDFTNSLTDEIEGLVTTLGGNASQSSSGITFNDASSYALVLPKGVLSAGNVIVIETGTMTDENGTTNGFFLMNEWTAAYKGTGGITLRGSPKKWCAYTGSWVESSITDEDYLSNKTIRIEIGESNLFTVKIDNETVLTYTYSQKGIMFGSSERAFHNMVIRDVKVY